MASSLVPSCRALRYTGYDSLVNVNDIVDDDMYDPVSNPGGIVNLGTTMNPLMSDFVIEFIETKYRIDAKLTIRYNYSSGSPELRATMADLANRHFSPSTTIQPENVIATNGLTGLVNSLIYTLLDKNETVLMPTPAYNLLVTAAQKRNDIKCVFADTEDIDQFSASAVGQYLTAFSVAMERAYQNGTPVKAILMCNPHNPLGKCYDREVLRAVVEFCHERQIHLIADEIYGLSALDGSFSSTLSLKRMPTENLHVIYGISKDWGFNGLRLGFMISHNKPVINTMKQAVGRFTRFSSLTENFFINFLSDRSFIDEVYIPTLRQRIHVAKSTATSFLSELKIPYITTSAGFFLWVDLSHWCRYFPSKDDSETSDIQLARHMVTHRVFMQPTKAFVTKHPGYFRFAYSRDETTLQEGLSRLKQALAALEAKNSTPCRSQSEKKSRFGQYMQRIKSASPGMGFELGNDQPNSFMMNPPESVTLDYTLHDLYALDNDQEDVWVVYAYAPPPNIPIAPSTPPLTRFPVQSPVCPVMNKEELAQSVFHVTAQRFGFCSGPMRIVIFELGPNHSRYQTDLSHVFSQLSPSQRPIPMYTHHPKDLTLSSPNSRLAVTVPLDWLTHLPHITDPRTHYNLLSKRGLAHSGLPTPQTTVIDTILSPGHHPFTDAQLQYETTRMTQPIRSHPLPFILKVPRVASIGQGTFIVETEKDRSAADAIFRDEVTSMLRALTPANETLRPCNIILQEMVSGDTVGLTFFVTRSGRAIFNCCTRQEVDDAYCWSGGLVSYAEQSALERHYRRIMETVARFLHQSGYYGPAGVDVMTDEGGTQLVVDLNVRITGTYHLGPLRGHFTRKGFGEAAALANQRVNCGRGEFEGYFERELQGGSLLVTAWVHAKDASLVTITAAERDVSRLKGLMQKVAGFVDGGGKQDIKSKL
ncbi:hypothetical protein FE257_011352 [Aspergillus nanangensis]|uniref:ATP-grasp domain-containing protein n=1 Tax=Aspergillus nanangensis TaxID=2582783 RepID=A0AAD4CHH6_ASPNN|nr:hypothetical protein FE257_011352 [Aspergillus nanangensis]